MATQKTKTTKTAKTAAPKATVADNTPGQKRVITGIVISNKMQKTIVVKVDRKVKHGQYMKYVLSSQKYKAHDETNQAKIGDRVEIIESRPLSRDKRWALRKIVEKATHSVEGATK